MSESTDKIIIKVQGLLAKAASTSFPEEADSFRAKADELMTKYAIEQFQLERQLRTPTSPGQKPIVKDVEISWYWDLPDEVAQVLYGVLWVVAEHCRCELAYASAHDRQLPVVGMPYDIDYLNILFTHLFLQMVDKMDPHPTTEDTLESALAKMKEAGMKWEDIYDRLVSAGLQEDLGEWSKSIAGKVNYAGKYTRFCAETGRARTYVSPSVYRRSFIQGFRAGVNEKFYTMRQEQGQNTGSMALALKDYRQEVKQALWDNFPTYKPKEYTEAERAAQSVADKKTSRRRGRAAPAKKISYGVVQSGLDAGRSVEIISTEDASRQKRAGELA